MNRRNDTASLSAAAQEYLLTLRVMAGDGSHVKAAQVARRMGVTTGDRTVAGRGPAWATQQADEVPATRISAGSVVVHLSTA